MSTLLLGRMWVWGEEEEGAGVWRYKAFILFTWSQIYEESEVLCSSNIPPTYSHPPLPNPLLCIVESIYVHISPNRHMIVIYNCKYKLKLLMTVYHTMETTCHRCRLLLLKSRLHVLSMPMCYIYIAAIYICDTCQM